MKNTINLLCLFALISFLMNGCRNRDSSAVENWPGGFILKPGKYSVSDTKQLITVWIDEEKLVRYSISNEYGKKLILSQERASAHSSWMFYFDKRGWLWFYSGDIGASVAKTNDAGEYQELPLIDQAELISEMPEEIYTRLPPSIQKKWKEFRKQ